MRTPFSATIHELGALTPSLHCACCCCPRHDAEAAHRQGCHQVCAVRSQHHVPRTHQPRRNDTQRSEQSASALGIKQQRVSCSTATRGQCLYCMHSCQLSQTLCVHHAHQLGLAYTCTVRRQGVTSMFVKTVSEGPFGAPCCVLQVVALQWQSMQSCACGAGQYDMRLYM